MIILRHAYVLLHTCALRRALSMGEHSKRAKDLRHAMRRHAVRRVSVMDMHYAAISAMPKRSLRALMGFVRSILSAFLIAYMRPAL